MGSSPDEVMDELVRNVREQSLPAFTAPPDDVRLHIEEKLAPRAAGAQTPSRCRVRAIRALGLMGYPWRANVLVSCLSDADEHVRTEAATALENLSGELFGADPQAWTEWLRALPADAFPGGRE
jgi:HEAT repeat protein